jgi:hypothetical protein
MQQLGCGLAGMTIIGGLLSICNNPMAGTWNLLEEKLSKAQIDLGKVILDNNKEEEKKLSKKDDKGRSKFCVSVDTEWNNHSSVKSYNSDSGHHITVGNRTGKVVATKTFRSREHDDGVCSQNTLWVFHQRNGSPWCF